MTRTEATAALAERFEALYGRAPRVLARAPGRVNLIGDHTDYCEGLALPIAIDLRTMIAAAPAVGGATGIRIASLREPRTLQDPLHIMLDIPLAPVGDWSDYLRGVIAGYAALAQPVPDLDVLIGGDLPLGAGLSSSASLELAFAHALEAAGATHLSAAQRMHLARRAEHDFAGMPCGILDQYSVSHAEAGHALLLDCRSETSKAIPVPESLALAVIDSGVRHALVDGGYEERLREARAAESALGGSLRDATLLGLEKLSDDTLRRRARHVVSENSRVLAFAEALAAADGTRAGSLMFASHKSLAHDYAVSCPEVDALVAAAREAGALGARMTGGGFGGAVVCLVDRTRQGAFEAAMAGWRERTGASAAPPRWVRPAGGAWAQEWPRA